VLESSSLLLIVGESNKKYPQKLCCFENMFILLSQLCVQVMGSAFLLKLHTSLCCKHINNFKCIRISILHYRFSKRSNFCTDGVITYAAVLYVEEIKL